MVFAPTPVLTVALERPADDVELHLHAGGQGIWQARMIRSLGVAVTLCACVGGEVGFVLQRLMAREGIELRIVDRSGTSGWYIDDRRDGERRRIGESPGQPLGRHEMDELYGLALAEGLTTSASVLSGPTHPALVPVRMYRRLAADLAGNGARIVADLAGPYLDAVLAAGVAFVKVSEEELVRHGRVGEGDEGAIRGVLRDLRREGARAVLISRAGRPALALLDGEAYEVEVPTLEEADHHGAGDSMTAGIAAVLARDGDLREAIRTGAAAGALNVTRHGLGTGNAEAIARLATRVRLAASPMDLP
jgi:1-phosphofructokinase